MHWILAGAGFVFIVALFYSAGFTRMESLADLITAISNYLARGTGSTVHEHPWYQYLSWFFFFKSADGWIRGEGLVLLFALAGFVDLFRTSSRMPAEREFLQILGLFSMLQLVAFSIIPYKTPWNALTFYPGLLTLAAVGVVWLYRRLKGKAVRIALALFLVTGGIHFVWQSRQLNYILDSDPRNPFVYAHPLPEVTRMTDRIEQLAAVMPEGRDTPLQVIVQGDDYWPLPWYLRRFSRVGWLNSVPEKGLPAPLIITSPELYDSVTEFIYFRPPPGQKSLYVPLFERDIALRPDAFLNAYIQYELLSSEETDALR
jgi:predicted membrane-bound mannosyltransferase